VPGYRTDLPETLDGIRLLFPALLYPLVVSQLTQGRIPDPFAAEKLGCVRHGLEE
jgi:hypothetical protein